MSQSCPCECVWSWASMWQTEEQVIRRCWYLPGLSVFIPSGLCQLDVLDQWYWRREAGGWGVRQVCKQDDNCLSLKPLWPEGGPELKPSPSLHPLSHPSVAFKHSYAHAGTNTQWQDAHMPTQIPLKNHLLTHARSHTHTRTHPPHTHTLSRPRQVFTLS